MEGRVHDQRTKPAMRRHSLHFFLLLSAAFLACFFAREACAATSTNAPLWQSIIDNEEKYAFDTVGPPMPDQVGKYRQETKLYEDMVQNFDEVGEDEPDFTFVMEAYSVPVESFRPALIRPEGEAIKESESNPFGEDDPLPEDVKSTSTYVDDIRPTYLPGEPLKMRSVKEVEKEGSQLGSLFKQTDKLKAETAAATVDQPAPPATPPEAAPETKPHDDVPAGKINAPTKKPPPAPDSDEETLANLKKAVSELGLDNKLNLDGKQQMGAPTAPAPAPSPLPTTKPAAKPVAKAAVKSAPAPAAKKAAKPAKRVTAPVPPKKPAVKPAVSKKKPAKKKEPAIVRVPVIDYTPSVPASSDKPAVASPPPVSVPAMEDSGFELAPADSPGHR
jgi:hypothetical protein